MHPKRSIVAALSIAVGCVYLLDLSALGVGVGVVLLAVGVYVATSRPLPGRIDDRWIGPT